MKVYYIVSSFIINQLRSGAEVHKPWYGSIVDESVTIGDFYHMIITGEVDNVPCDKDRELEGVEMVLAFAGK